MDIQKLVHMANRIGDFHASNPERDQALSDIATHIQKFWAPRMRRELLCQLDAPGTRELNPLVRESLAQAREALMPPA